MIRGWLGPFQAPIGRLALPSLQLPARHGWLGVPFCVRILVPCQRHSTLAAWIVGSAAIVWVMARLVGLDQTHDVGVPRSAVSFCPHVLMTRAVGSSTLARIPIAVKCPIVTIGIVCLRWFGVVVPSSPYSITGCG